MQTHKSPNYRVLAVTLAIKRGFIGRKDIENIFVSADCLRLRVTLGRDLSGVPKHFFSKPAETHKKVDGGLGRSRL